MGDLKARTWFGLTSLAVTVGVGLQVYVAATAKAGFFHSPATRALNVFVFFTILSNLIVGKYSFFLALKTERRSVAFQTLNLTGLVSIVITGVVYHAVISQLFDFEGWALVADNLTHTIVPLMAVIGWLAFGPRGPIPRRVVWLSLIYPVAWFVFTLVRGEFVGFYPYQFIDVAKLGYARALTNCVWVAVLYVGIGFGARTLDGWLIRVRTATT